MKIVQTFDANGTSNIAITGELDASSAIEMDNVIKKAFDSEIYNILIDCKCLNYISSAGLGVFVSYQQDLADQNGQFVFHSMSDKVYNVFELLGLHSIFSIVPNENEAQNLLKK